MVGEGCRCWGKPIPPLKPHPHRGGKEVEGLYIFLILRPPPRKKKKNKHYTEANEFVEQHYRAVVEDFALFSDLVAEDEEEDTSEAFEEADF